ncbi:MAG: flagellar M-ring protein FliF [FCB group bacterium]|nr:flagellar M-ring protein FliF [FCB group bacterium]
MDYFKQVLTRLAEIVKRMSVSQVVMLVAIVVGTVIGAVSVAGWVGKVTYQPLYTNLDPAEAAEVTRHLSDKGIAYKLSAGGATIEVSENGLYEARLSLASQGLPHSGNVGYSIFDETNLGMTDFLQKLNFRRALEGELARTISALNEVQTARVHIVIPEERLFADHQREATASVLLKLKRRGGLDKRQVNGITHLVASSVEGLGTGNITIVDYAGNLLSSNTGGDQLASLTTNQLEMTHAVEQDLAHKAQTMLDGVLGPGKAIVRVTAELDFQQYSRTSENYDPNMSAVRSEQKNESSDLATTTGLENAEDKQDAKSEVTVTNYEISRTVENVVNALGTINRLSVAVLLDGTYNMVEGADGVNETIYEPRPQEEIDRLSGIVKNAVGFSSDRNDQLEVVNIAFDKSYLTDQQKMLDNQFTREFYLDIVKKTLMVLAALLVLLYLRKKLKRFFHGLAQILPKAGHGYSSSGQSKSAVEGVDIPQQEEVPEIVPEKRQAKLVDQMQKAAKNDPDEIARVIKTMMVD